MPSKTAYAPAHSIHSAPLEGNKRRLASANCAQACPSARSRRRDSARSANTIVLGYGTRHSGDGRKQGRDFVPDALGDPFDGVVGIDEFETAGLESGKAMVGGTHALMELDTLLIEA